MNDFTLIPRQMQFIKDTWHWFSVATYLPWQLLNCRHSLLQTSGLISSSLFLGNPIRITTNSSSSSTSPSNTKPHINKIHDGVTNYVTVQNAFAQVSHPNGVSPQQSEAFKIPRNKRQRKRKRKLRKLRVGHGKRLRDQRER